MTDREQLEKMQAELENEEKTYDRFKKMNVLEKLIDSTNEKTGELISVIVPLYHHDIEFMKETIHNLGYSPEYVEDWNYYYDTTCCYVKFS